jgi:hypothetical protein
VIWRRSADEPLRGAAGAAAAAAGGAASPSLVPHWAQKREPAALAWPQAPQLKACGAPHCGQKRLSPGISRLQLGQAFVFAIADRITGGHVGVMGVCHSSTVIGGGFRPDAGSDHDEPVTPDERAQFMWWPLACVV